VAAMLLGLRKVMVRVETRPEIMLVGLKDLSRVGGPFKGEVTIKVAVAGAALWPLLVCNAPAASELT